MRLATERKAMSQRSATRSVLTLCLTSAFILSACASVNTHPPGSQTAVDVESSLSMWRATDEKQAILHYVASVTEPGGPEFIPPEHRIATFDFDGTIGCEKPDYMEVMVAMQRLCELTEDKPELLEEPLYEAACDGDLSTLDAQVEDVLLTAFEGESQDFYVEYVEEFLRTAQHPRFERPYGELFYAPMQQLIEFLRANDFTVYIVSGSQQGFTRGYGTSRLGFGAERTIGYAVDLEYSVVDDSPALLRQDGFLSPSVGGKGKVEIIRNRIGRPPVFAFGNSMGDFEMLQYTTSHDYPSLGLILVHDDPDEYVYRDDTLIQHAEDLGWQVVRMQESFEVIFPDAGNAR